MDLTKKQMSEMVLTAWLCLILPATPATACTQIQLANICPFSAQTITVLNSKGLY